MRFWAAQVEAPRDGRPAPVMRDDLPEHGAAGDHQPPPQRVVAARLDGELLVIDGAAAPDAALLGAEGEPAALAGVERLIAQVEHHRLLEPAETIGLDEAVHGDRS